MNVLFVAQPTDSQAAEKFTRMSGYVGSVTYTKEMNRLASIEGGGLFA